MTGPHQKIRRRLPLSTAAAVMVVTGGGLALLIWAKLRLVTGAPRTAYAVPEVQEPDETGGLLGSARPPDAPEPPAEDADNPVKPAP